MQKKEVSERRHLSGEVLQVAECPAHIAHIDFRQYSLKSWRVNAARCTRSSVVKKPSHIVRKSSDSHRPRGGHLG